MISSIKQRAQTASKFAREHTTLVACSATAVGTYALTTKYHIKVSEKFIYDLGVKYGVVATVCADALDFIADKELSAEFYQVASVAEQLKSFS